MIVGNPWLEAFEAAISPIGALVPVEPSAAVAKHRLRKIIAADREAVPAAAWLKIRRPIDGMGLLAWPLMSLASATGRMGAICKPRCRWEVRR